ncbi:hypothetical protein KIPB_001872 [Kipferlia bialata]|nr:hypothetical protein KIPB_000660 [Kipferlia bialata]GCA62192.1 hypothetical protein KIPB_001860 [Kipferlia bialata]GCA62194.1 hypothetical protein KIPB_001872 [Kipferlia bialata]|eukprot:g660.t1
MTGAHPGVDMEATPPTCVRIYDQREVVAELDSDDLAQLVKEYMEMEPVPDGQGARVSNPVCSNPRPRRIMAKFSTEATTWSCTECDKTYRRESDLTDHVEAVHRGRRWKCSVCDKGIGI